MNETLVHRGPDSDGSMIDGPCGLAMRRLSIIDLAGGDQPIGNEDDRIQVIQNGEIYNYGELMDELRGKGHTFSTHSDTEVLVHLYEDRGPSFVEALRGMFAIGWSPPAKSIIERRRMARPHGPLMIDPSESGPRWTSVSFIAASAAGSGAVAPSRLTRPHIPHMRASLESGRDR